MDPQLKSLLQNIEYGDFEDIPKLAEWLKIHDDPRAELARQASTLEPQEIAEQLVKVRSVRPSNDSILEHLAELALMELWTEPPANKLYTSDLEYAPKTPRWWPPSDKECLNDVENALATKVLSTDVARAMTVARRLKVDRLLAAFQAAEQANPVSPPAPG